VCGGSKREEKPLSQIEPESIALENIVAVLQQPKSGLDADSERWLHELLQHLPAAIYTTDAAGRITFYNEAAVALWGCRPRLNSDQWCGSWHLYRPDGSLLPHDQCPMAIALKERRAIKGQEAVAERPDGTRVPFMAFPSPLRDATGQVIGAVNMLIDISEREHNEQAAQQLAAIVGSSDDAIVSKNLDGIINSWNAGAERLFGYTAEEVIGKPITILIPPELQDEETTILTRIRRGDRIDHYETTRQRKDGSLVDISLTVSPVRNAEGKIVGASKIARDISQRKRADERINLLVRELDHRAKNLLALVQATVHLTNAETPAELKHAIAGRIQAIANAHALFVQSRWEGADLRTLVEEELAPYGQGCAKVKGPSLVLEPSTAQSMAVVLHELATNAVKYGALSDAGHVEVDWSRGADGRFIFRWTETGGPPVKPATRRGFGARVMEQMIKRQLKGELSFDWCSQGLICEITLHQLTPTDTTHA
jgi:two-component system, chemotaxis family, CheB/CheR fusion protein